MTTSELQRLIAAVQRAQKHPSHLIEISETHYALCNFVLAHAADIAERERLERAVVEAAEVARLCVERDQGTDTHLHLLACEVERDALRFAQDMLTAHLVAHADDGAAT